MDRTLIIGKYNVDIIERWNKAGKKFYNLVIWCFNGNKVTGKYEKMTDDYDIVRKLNTENDIEKLFC